MDCIRINDSHTNDISVSDIYADDIRIDGITQITFTLMTAV